MNKLIAVASLLLASFVSVDAQHRLIGTPTGMLHPDKQRKIEQALNFQKGGMPKGATRKDAAPKEEKSKSMESSRGLQWGGYQHWQSAPIPPPPTMYWPYKPYDGYGVPVPPMMTSKKYGWMMGKKSSSMPEYSPDDCRFSHTIVKNPFNDIDEMYCDDDDCEMFVSAEHIRLQEFTSVIAQDPNTTQVIGTTYIWGTQFPEDSDGNTDTSATIQGQCVRTGIDAAASGQCSFSIITDVGQITMTGALMTNGGNLAITGGSGEFAGVIGDAQFNVVAIGAGDPFDDAAYYNIELTLGLIVCPAQYLGD